ncbi:hypothetical protein [Streptomyces sp. NPDC058694]
MELLKQPPTVKLPADRFTGDAYALGQTLYTHPRVRSTGMVLRLASS